MNLKTSRPKKDVLCKGAFKYYIIMILTFFDPPTQLSSDVIISYTHLNDDVIISSYPPTYWYFFPLFNKYGQN